MEKGARFPTTEVVGYCRMSLRDMNAMHFMQIGGLHPSAGVRPPWLQHPRPDKGRNATKGRDARPRKPGLSAS